MITKREKNKIKKVLGNDYCNPISEYLINNAIRNKLGHPFSNASITNVMNGRDNEVLERAIFAAVAKKTIAIEKAKKNRKQILEKAS